MRLEWIFGIPTLNSKSTYVETQSENLNITNLGIETMHNITDEVYTYKTSLLSPEQDDSALLNLLWRYKGRIDSYTVNCLLSLVYLLSLDDTVAEYFATSLPGPTYC